MFGLDFFDPTAYRAPRNEAAALKGVPIEYRDHPVIQFMTSNKVGGRVRYFGPRNYEGADCLREDAETFSLFMS